MIREPVRILLVDDHTLVRGVLAEHLRRQPDFLVVGDVSTADEAVQAAVRSAPDVILMDIEMPGLDCFNAAQKISAIRPQAKIVFLSAHVKDHYVDRALKVHASGYLTKSEIVADLIAAIREVAAGGAPFSEEVRDRMVIDCNGVSLGDKTRSRAATLTPREMESLCYIAKGLGKKEIARIMNLSIKTVEGHTTRLMSKLDIHDRVELTLFAYREGIVKP